MTLYLSLNGTSDYIKTPSITFDEIVLDAYIHYRTSGAWNCMVYQSSSSYLEFNNSGSQSSTGYVTPPTIDGTAKFALGSNDTRHTVDMHKSSIMTSISYLFSKSGTTDFSQVNVYDVKFYNSGVLVAHYDMSTGTVQDTSGNGNHATLTGGTWLDDGAGGTGTTLTVSLSDSITLSEILTKSPSKRLSDSLTLSETISKQGNLTKSDSLSTSDSINKSTNKSLTDSITLSDSISKRLTVTVVDTVNLSETTSTSQGGHSATLNDTILVTDAIVKKVISSFKADTVNTADTDYDTITKSLLDSITVTDSISKSNGKAIILSDSITVTDAIFKAVNVLKSETITLVDNVQKQAKIGIYDVIISTDDMRIYLPNVPEYQEVIQFKLNITQNQTVNLTIMQRQQINLKL